MTKVANVDGDVLKYLAGFAVQKTIWTHTSGEWFEGKDAANEWLVEKFDGPKKNDKGVREGIRAWMQDNWCDADWESEIQLEPFKNCAFIIDNKIAEIQSVTKADKVLVCLTPATTFRHDIAVTAPYKGNRVSPKPEYSEKIIEYFHNNYSVAIIDGLEADDIMGMESKGNVTCTNDKDLQMVSGEHYNFSTGDHFYVDPVDADEWFYAQLMAGDPTDNIKGLPGYGMKKALDFVQTYDVSDSRESVELMTEIEMLYREAYGVEWPAVLREHAQLVYILRPGDTLQSAGWVDLIHDY